MIVYGDPHFEITLEEAIEKVRLRHTTAVPGSLEQCRTLLIQVGQLEQGVADADLGPQIHSHVERATDIAATAFCGALFGTPMEIAKWNDIGSELTTFVCSPAPLRIKVPEGFAFYTLFPEQYCFSVIKWLRQNRVARAASILVVGLRSIGTTLSAIVTAMLRRMGYPVRRITVRPSGHPFEREVRLATTACADHALVVDEGPGMSGSSMAATAEALICGGVQTRKIAFLPAHANQPGPAASKKIKDFWKLIPSFTTELKEILWEKQTWEGRLARQSAKLLGEKGVVTKDLGGGRWREEIFTRKQEWPAINRLFERTKLLCIGKGDAAILWKFQGLCFTRNFDVTASEIALQQIKQTGSSEFDGFVGTPWITGRRLQKSDGKRQCILDQLAEHIMSASGSVLSTMETTDAVKRLSQIIEWNLADILAPHFASQITNRLQMTVRENRRCGDGRMEPLAWVELNNGQIIKPNATAHECDHTIVGPQPIEWDIAGTIVEWDLDIAASRYLLRRLGAVGKPSVIPSYCIAYAAFRCGFCTIAPIENDSEEGERLRIATAFYRKQVLKHTDAVLSCATMVQ